MELRNFRMFFGFFLNKPGYFINLAVAIIVGYYAYLMIEKVPKPGTFFVLLKYLFSFSGDYFWTIILSIIAFISVATLGVSTVINTIKLYKEEGFFSSTGYNEDYELTIFGKTLCALLALVGLVLFLWSFYYFSYAAMLLLLLLFIGIVAIFFANNIGNSK